MFMRRSLVYRFLTLDSDSGPDLGEGRVGSCPGPPQKGDPTKLNYTFEYIVYNNIRYITTDNM